MSWYHVAGHQQDSVVCTCVRLSRNLTGYPFPAHLEAAGAKEIIGKVEGVLGKNGFLPTDFSEITRGAADSLAEKRFVGPRFARESLPHALFLNDPCNRSVAVCEEDHIRIRSILAGLSLKDAYEGAVKASILILTYHTSAMSRVNSTVSTSYTSMILATRSIRAVTAKIR